jgi:hypothetical protein
MLAVALTAILIAHDKALQLGDLQVPAAMFPGYRGESLKAQQTELRSVLPLSDGTTLVGTKSGVYRLKDTTVTPVAGLEAVEVKQMLTGPDGVVLVASKSGAYQVREGVARRLLAGDMHALVPLSDGGLLAVPAGGRSPLRSDDLGNTWNAVTMYGTALATLPLPTPPRSVPLSKVVKDIHTGAAFTGKRLEWVWIDTMGSVLAMLVGTGVWLWWIARRREQARAQLSATSTPTGSSAPVRRSDCDAPVMV